ncbi:hypothetical protein [Paraburkholderia sp. SOS3]|uniref:hypothetical protein n=1 Tax=Paraburkholderia sp. SOS3 TaxID=1926494 RepID=UPI0012EBCF4A|nr:hypothetical protein [Paraburkholderia sp. SOS3]
MEESTDEAPNSSPRLANYFIKALLFLGLFLLAVLFVSTYPFPMTEEHLRWWSAFSVALGTRDARHSWVSVTLLMDLVVTVIVYLVVAKRVEVLASEPSIVPIAKSLLFAGLFLATVRFIRTPTTDEYTDLWLAAAHNLGIHSLEDFEDFTLAVTLFVDLVVTIVVYTTIMKCWRIFRARRRSNHSA